MANKDIGYASQRVIKVGYQAIMAAICNEKAMTVEQAFKYIHGGPSILERQYLQAS